MLPLFSPAKPRPSAQRPRTAPVLLGLWALFAAPLAWTAPAPPVAAKPAPADTVQPATRQALYAFTDLGTSDAIQLRGMDAANGVSLGIRRDEMVTQARLLLRFAHSPALLPDLSHLKVTLNGELVATLPLDKESAGREQEREVSLEPLYFSDYNQLRFQLVGHYARDCEDARHSSLWITISSQSRLELSLRPLELHNDLAQLPAPFFDQRDNRALNLPFVFANRPSLGTLRAAGAVASWFGTLADYRNVRFPVVRNALPDRHALVFATNQDRIAGLELPPVEAPTLSMVPHPANPNLKLLLIQGRDESDLKLASDALVLNHALFSGQSTVIRQLDYPPRRRAYDAPAWLPADRPVQFGELVDHVSQLQADGYTASPIRLNLRLPPDLWDWRGQGARINLNYRYTPPAQPDDSTLDVSLNNRFVRAFRLKPTSGSDSENGRLALPLWEQTKGVESQASLTPALQMGGNNRLQMRFVFDDSHGDGARCAARPQVNVHGAVDANSAIDLTALPHYAALPNLGLFANSGFPYTKFADLAETTVVLPERPNTEQMETLLALLGHMGKFTGAPALRFGLITADKIDNAGDSDLLLVDASASQDLLKRWESHFPAVVTPSRRNVPIEGTLSSLRGLLEGDADTPQANGAAMLDGAGPIAAVVGFESPLKAGRSVVALMGGEPAAAQAVISALDDEAQARRFRDDVVFIRHGKVASFRVGDVYHVGHLPPWAWLHYRAAQHPLLMALTGIGGSLLLAFLAYWMQRRGPRQHAPD